MGYYLLNAFLSFDFKRVNQRTMLGCSTLGFNRKMEICSKMSTLQCLGWGARKHIGSASVLSEKLWTRRWKSLEPNAFGSVLTAMTLVREGEEGGRGGGEKDRRIRKRRKTQREDRDCSSLLPDCIEVQFDEWQKEFLDEYEKISQSGGTFTARPSSPIPADATPSQVLLSSHRK